MKRSGSSNEGIQATNVTADVLAVGRAAKAEKHVWSTADEGRLAAAIAELRQAVAALPLQPQTRQAIETDLARLEEDKRSPADTSVVKHTIEKVVSKLKAVGVIVGDVASLAEPVTKIAGILKLIHPFF